jgi:DNA replication protein DnaC
MATKVRPRFQQPGRIFNRRWRATLVPGAAILGVAMNEICPKCYGTGMQVIRTPEGQQFAQSCDCQIQIRVERALNRANVPDRYRGKSLQSFETDGKHPSVFSALLHARKFVDNFPFGMEGLGLLIVGSSGLGKTHLAAGILQALVIEKRVNGLFFDYHDLLKKIQNSYNPSVAATELSVLRPVFDAEVLVLDDLGATRPTDWVWDTVAHILNARYGRNQTTIVTTNFPNSPALVQREATALGSAGRAARGETLGDRIGDRMRSRLQEMCVVIEMQGEDRREHENRAAFRVF